MTGSCVAQEAHVQSRVALTDLFEHFEDVAAVGERKAAADAEGTGADSDGHRSGEDQRAR